MIKKQKVSVWVTVKIMADILEVTEPKQVMNTTLQNLFKDNEVLIDASKNYVKTGEFVMIKIIEATEFDLYGEPVQ